MIGLTVSEKTRIMNVVNKVPELIKRVNELELKVNDLTPEEEIENPIEDLVPDAPETTEVADKEPGEMEAGSEDDGKELKSDEDVSHETPDEAPENIEPEGPGSEDN